MKYLFITLHIQNGEYQHTLRVLHTTNAKNINFAAERYAATFYGRGKREDDFWWFYGEITVYVQKVVEISEYEYNLMSNIFEGRTTNDYFKIVHAGYQSDLQREEIQIHAGDNGNVFLIKSDNGFIVDVYNQEDNIDTLTIWEDDLEPTIE